MDGLLTMLKNLKQALFQTFSTWHRILSAFTALYWPSTAFYWPSTTKYQPVPPYTDPVPSWINHYRLILIQCHQVPTSRATFRPSTIMYQPVSPSFRQCARPPLDLVRSLHYNPRVSGSTTGTVVEQVPGWTIFPPFSHQPRRQPPGMALPKTLFLLLQINIQIVMSFSRP